jgi:hypothetical protein
VVAAELPRPVKLLERRNSKCELRPPPRKSGCEVEKNEAGISLENSDGHEEGLQQKKGEQGAVDEVRKRRDQVQKASSSSKFKRGTVAVSRTRLLDHLEAGKSLRREIEGDRLSESEFLPS